MNQAPEINPRQRINLSDEAQAIISGDCFTFTDETGAVVKYSRIINNIISNFAEVSTIRWQSKESAKRLWSKKPPISQNDIPSLNKASVEYLERPAIRKICEDFNITPGKFVKAIIEEYAELPFIERERIYYKNIVDIINNNINCVLEFTSGDITFEVKPYAIMSDKHSTFNYFVCRVLSVGGLPPVGDGWASFRISRIKKLHPIKNTNFSFSYPEEDEVKETVRQKGVAFLLGDLFDIKVKMSENGKLLYNTVLFQRPDIKTIDGDIYSFRCTARQADVYFFKFGSDAVILEPKSISKEFLARYKKAFNSYGLLLGD